MGELAPRPPHKPAYLDRPQRFGFLPTLAFWNRRDVAKANGPMLAVFVVLWLLLLGTLADHLLLVGWPRRLAAGLGPYLFLGLLERYLRKRLRARRAMLTPSRPAATEPRDRQSTAE